jgi:L-lactate dehydrogenase
VKVSIIGGGGRVGSSAAYALQLGGLVREIAIVDASKDAAAGEALDLRHGASFAAAQKIYGGGPELIEGSDIVIVTAGLRRKPDESRLELMNRNAALFCNILEDIRRAKLPSGAILVVVTNPVDLITQVAVESDIVPADRVIGLGTLLDTTRFRSLLAEHFDLDPTDVNAVVVGEHGDSMVPVLSSATINGVPISSLSGYTESKAREIADYTNKSGSEVLSLKGGAGWAVGLAIRELVHAIMLDKRSVLPLSTLQQGALGISEICLSLPTVIGRSGVLEVLEIALSDDEMRSLKESESVLKSRWGQLDKCPLSMMRLGA